MREDTINSKYHIYLDKQGLTDFRLYTPPVKDYEHVYGTYGQFHYLLRASPVLVATFRSSHQMR